MEVSPDLKELLALFRSRGVECAVAGAHALAFHGLPRFTADVDLLLNRSDENVDRVLAALGDLGFGDLGLVPVRFLGRDELNRNKRASGRLKDRAVYGKVRIMTPGGLKRKCNMPAYIEKVDRLARLVNS